MHGVRVAALVVALCAASCSRKDQQLIDHAEAFRSLSSTTATIVQHWLDGSVSGTYALTALDRTYTLVEQQRASLTQSASMVIDTRGASLSDSAAELARRIATLINAVRSADAGAARQQLDGLPFSRVS